MKTWDGPTGIFIDNEFVPSVSGKTFPTVNPTNGQVIARVAESQKEDVERAVKSSRKAFQTWKNTSGPERSRLLHKFADLIERDKQKIAEMETLDIGMHIDLSLTVIGMGVDVIRYQAGWADKLEGKYVPTPDKNLFAYTIHEPLGVCAAIQPWNFPFPLTMWKFGPAIACGNTLIIKPSEKSPLSSLYIGVLAKEAGFPPGVINILPGYGDVAGSAISHHMDINKVGFTGSLPIGQKILKAAAESNLKRVTLELGGKSPLIVCEDADLDVAAGLAHGALFNHQGQACIASSRVFVHENVYDEFIKKSKALAAERLAGVGDPSNPKTVLGPVVDEIQLNRIKQYIDSGVKDGAKVACGGKQLQREGYYIEPTIFYDVKEDMKIIKEEIFGPVMAVIKYTDLKAVIKRANDTTYGLAAGLVTNNVNTAHLVAKELEAGTVFINTWGNTIAETAMGGYKMSGIGRENGEYVLHEYTQVKQVTMALNPASAKL